MTSFDRKHKINTFYEAQNEFNRSILDLNEPESLKFFNKFHENVLDTLFEKQNGKKYKKLQKKFDELVNLANIGNVSLFPLQWLDLTIKRATKYHDKSLDLKRVIELYPTIMEFRNNVIQLINPENLSKEEIYEKEKFVKVIYDKLNNKPEILELLRTHLSSDDYYMNVEYPKQIYANKMLEFHLSFNINGSVLVF
jgi:hypothetical protein